MIPTLKQYDGQQLKFIGFIHFGINTFLDREWGEGNEDLSQFIPTELNRTGQRLDGVSRHTHGASKAGDRAVPNRSHADSFGRT